MSCRPMLRLIALIIALGLSHISCQENTPTGSLLVKAPGAGQYEIYRVAGEEPMHFVAEEIGNYNEEVHLSVGSYLVLADCSHKLINVNSREQQLLTVHSVEFIPPILALPGDKFSVQCDRFSKTKSRQNIKNRYRLNILHGNRELLVGMVPLRIDFTSMEEPKEPKELSYYLSGIQLNEYEGITPKTLFFVSPSNNLIAVTENQEFGHWLYLLPGQYTVEVNGTTKSVTLEKGESLSINPAFIRVSSSEDLNIGLSSDILGSPLYAILNNNHWLDLNISYPVLPGEAKLRLSNSHSPIQLNLVEQELLEKKARSVTVHSDCPPWEWNCLGQKKIFLYETDKPYAFAEGIADVPILFFEENVWLSIQGSRDIRYKLSNQVVDHDLKMGKIKLIPSHHHRQGQITDLVRIEAISLPQTGHTLDLPLEQAITIPLIEGRYYLGQYTSSYASEYERRRARRILSINQGSIPEIGYKVYVSEKKLNALNEIKERKNNRQKKKKKMDKNLSRSIISLNIH